jgi:hypothetical protein
MKDGCRDKLVGEEAAVPHGQVVDQERAVFTFATTHQAMVAEDVLREEPLHVEVVPPPHQLSAGCGLALRISLRDVPAARAALSREGAAFEALHALGPDQRDLRRLA